MIQRIQTVYLLIITALLAVMFFVNFAVLSEAGTDKLFFDTFGVQYSSNPPEYLYQTFYLTALLIITTLVAFFTIFMYRHRWIQIRMCFVMGICQLGIQIYIGMYIYQMHSLIEIANAYEQSVKVFSIIPIICMILTYLAFRGIARDEALIRSLNRIR